MLDKYKLVKNCCIIGLHMHGKETGKIEWDFTSMNNLWFSSNRTNTFTEQLGL
jgi:hypothetical protein